MIAKPGKSGDDSKYMFNTAAHGLPVTSQCRKITHWRPDVSNKGGMARRENQLWASDYSTHRSARIVF